MYIHKGFELLSFVIVYAYIFNGTYAQWTQNTKNVSTTSISINGDNPVLYTDGVYSQVLSYSDIIHNVRVCTIESGRVDIFCTALTPSCKCIIWKPILLSYTPLSTVPVVYSYDGGCANIVFTGDMSPPNVTFIIEWRLEISDYIPPSVIYSVSGPTDFHIFQLYNMIRNNLKCHSEYTHQTKLEQSITVYRSDIPDKTYYSEKYKEYVAILFSVFILYVVVIGSVHFC